MKKTDAHSRVTALIEVLEFEDLNEDEEYNKLNKFFHELSQEIYHFRKQNYNLGLRAIEPELTITADRIQMTSPLYLEKDLPELSSMVFKTFIDFCNLFISVAVDNRIALSGFASIGNNYRSEVYSSINGIAHSKETMVLKDLLKVFSFDDIFPEGFQQNVIAPVSVPLFYGKDLKKVVKMLSEIREIGIFMPSDIISIPATEVAVYSDMLIDTRFNGKNFYCCNWKTYIPKNDDNFSADKMMEDLEYLSQSDNVHAPMWKKFLVRFNEI